jgi:hypothetical protein
MATGPSMVGWSIDAKADMGWNTLNLINSFDIHFSIMPIARKNEYHVQINKHNK